MKSKVAGIILSLVGIVGGITTYSFRPPSNFSEMMVLAAQNRVFLQQPAYIGALVLSILCLVAGIYILVRKSGKASETQ